MKKIIVKYLSLLILCSVFATQAHAQKLDMDAFGRLPIQHEGRIKPLRSFAELTLKSLSGKDTLYGRSAQEWLADSVFDPSSAAQIKVFEITDKTLKAQLRLKETQKYFSLSELSDPLSQTLPLATQLATKEPSNLNPEQNALITLHERAALYMKLLRSFSAVLPLDIDIPANKTGARDFIALEPQAKKLEADLKKIIARKGTDASKYSAQWRSQAPPSPLIKSDKAANATIFYVYCPGRGEKTATHGSHRGICCSLAKDLHKAKNCSTIGPNLQPPSGKMTRKHGAPPSNLYGQKIKKSQAKILIRRA